MRRSLVPAMAVVLVSVSALSWTAAVRGEPLDAKAIAADTKWAAHLDVDALHASSTFQKARDELLKVHPEAETALAVVREVWKFNPRADLHGITIYGSQIKKDTGVAIVHAKVDKDLLVEKVQQAPNHQASSYGTYELHTWLHAEGSAHQRSMTGTFYKPDMMIFGASVDEVKAAIDVLDGKKSNLAEAQPMLAGSIPQGAILCAGITGVADADLPHKPPVAKKVESVLVVIGESQGDVFFHGILSMKQADSAQQVKAVMDGAVALAALMHGDDAETMKLIDAVSVTASDRSVTVDWRAPVDAVLAHAKKACEQFRAHMQGHH
jgi:hypothetical protein